VNLRASMLLARSLSITASTPIRVPCSSMATGPRRRRRPHDAAACEEQADGIELEDRYGFGEGTTRR